MGRCYRGTVSAGSAGGPHSVERRILLSMLGGVQSTLGDVWSNSKYVGSLLVVSAVDQFKQHSVQNVVTWLRKHKGVQIEDHHVHFFDDHSKNVPPFKGTGFNAKQISCSSRATSEREKFVGFCGGTSAEVVAERGVHPCPPPPENNLRSHPRKHNVSSRDEIHNHSTTRNGSLRSMRSKSTSLRPQVFRRNSTHTLSDNKSKSTRSHVQSRVNASSSSIGTDIESAANG